MKTALVAGATGLVGSALVDQLIADPRYTKVTILVRKPIDRQHQKLQQMVFDYENPDKEKIKADHVFCCLGTTIKTAGSQEAFRRVDHDYPLLLANAAYQNGCRVFGIITAVGSNARSRIFYNRVKGEVEEQLKKIPFDNLLIFRPSMLDGPRKEFRLGEVIGRVIMRGIWFLLPAGVRAIHANQVAASMIDNINQNEPGIRYVESAQMQKYAVKK